MVPRFEPFRALRYTGPDQPVDLATLASPPYDVIDEPARAALEACDPHNSVRLDFPHDEAGQDGYELAARRLVHWTAANVLAVDDTPTLSVYRMTAPGVDGTPFTTFGVIGALGLEPPGTGDVLPHEQTTPKDKADRLSLITATEANLSPIWGLSMAAGLGARLATLAQADPTHVATDADGIVHELWIVNDTDTIEGLATLVGAQPIVIADGHHRFETALVYAERRRANDGSPTGSQAYDRVMALVVELAEDQLAVHPIHRIVTGLAPTGVEAFAPWFEITPADAQLVDDADLIARLVQTGALALVNATGVYTLRPRLDAFDTEIGLDSERVAIALTAQAGTAVRYHHDVATVTEAGRAGPGTAGILLRPVTVAQIAAVAHARTRMPAKSTFFWPKPRTGMLFRPLAPDTLSGARPV